MVKIENSGIASLSTAVLFSEEFKRFGIPPDVAASTWNHEMDHYHADPKKGRGGEFGYTLDVKLRGSMILASFIAYYRPIGERSYEDLMSIANGPPDKSDQDQAIYDMAWKSWNKKMREEKEKAAKNAHDEEPEVPSLIAIPRRSKEKDDDYESRTDIVKKFAEKIEKLSQAGHIPPIESILSRDFSEIKKHSWPVIKRAYEEALIECTIKIIPHRESITSIKLHPDRRINPKNT